MPEKDLEELFTDIQMAAIFADSKTLVDCIPLQDPMIIVAAYKKQKGISGFSLKDFVLQHFELPAVPDRVVRDRTADMVTHLHKHWLQLVREAKSPGPYHSLINLPYPYIVPGGRFREMFYWDSYFTIIGLLESSEEELALGMIRNFDYLVHTYGHIPNGNRSYFLSRSQPPFLAEMLKAYAQKHGMDSIIEFLPALQKEYCYWTKDDKSVNIHNTVSGKSVWLDGMVLNRYSGAIAAPRPEAFNKEYTWAQALPQKERPGFYLNLQAACESGWDFSSRWFKDSNNKTTIQCESLIPVCLNSLLYNCEMQLSAMYKYKADHEKAKLYDELALFRKAAIDKYCWSDVQHVFTDYQFANRIQSSVISLATVYPLFFGIATQQQADAIAKMIGENFLKEAGVVTTLCTSGEQWDAPNGWAPLQWLTVIGLSHYGYTNLAKMIATRWLTINKAVYQLEGKMMEKYNVVHPSLPGGGGNYANQDGFGWTNGVALALHEWLKST